MQTVLNGRKGVANTPNQLFLPVLPHRCSPDELGFPAFAAATASGPGGLSAMPYLKSSPYLMSVDTLHSMGYPGEARTHAHAVDFAVHLMGHTHACRTCRT